MNVSAVFIRRPIATTLLTIGLALAGMLAFRLLPVSPLPQVDFPTISVSAGGLERRRVSSVCRRRRSGWTRINGMMTMQLCRAGCCHYRQTREKFR